MESYDVIVVGAGPAGLSTAIYTLRGHLKTLILENDTPGGKVVRTSEITNWPGISHIEGSTLAYNMFEQVLSLNATYKYGKVEKIIVKRNAYVVVTDDAKYKTKAIVIATGTKYRSLGIDREDELYGKGISYCAVCDAKLYENKSIAVIGGGDSALKEAIYLANFASDVFLIHRRDEFRASPELIDKMIRTSNIICKTPCEVVQLKGESTLSSVIIKDNQTQLQEEIFVEGLFPFIGSLPATEFLQGMIQLDEKGYILVNENMETNLENIYAVGDVIAKPLRQIVTACSDGAIAGQHIVEKKII